MLDKNKIEKIKEEAENFFKKMTLPVIEIRVGVSNDRQETSDNEEEKKEVVSLEIKIDDPQILIGQGGQTLFEIQRLLRMVLNKKLEEFFYLNLDINNYKGQKVEYLKNMVRRIADQVISEKEEKSLPPMSSYERRIIHSELSGRNDMVVESQGEGVERHIVIRPK